MTNQMSKVAVIIGPTAVGKTATSIHLAKKFRGEIISGDSMQIYRGMDIGTAKISQEEMDGIPHHLIDIKEPTDAYSVAEYQEEVRKKISEIESRGALPIIVGGTGLYIQSVLYDYQFSEVIGNQQLRKTLEKKAEKHGNEALYKELVTIDKGAVDLFHPNNVRKIIRALEIYYESGQKPSERQPEEKPPLLYQSAIIGLTMDRDLLYERINDRVDQMMQAGLLDEVGTLYNAGVKDVQSIQAIGYKELYQYFDGALTLPEATELLKQNSRRYAKRQLTWFRNKMDVEWFDMTELHNSAKKIVEISQFVEGKLSL